MSLFHGGRNGNRFPYVYIYISENIRISEYPLPIRYSRTAKVLFPHYPPLLHSSVLNYIPQLKNLSDVSIFVVNISCHSSSFLILTSFLILSDSLFWIFSSQFFFLSYNKLLLIVVNICYQIWFAFLWTHSSDVLRNDCDPFKQNCDVVSNIIFLCIWNTQLQIQIYIHTCCNP